MRRRIKFEYWQNPYNADTVEEWVDEDKAEVTERDHEWEPRPPERTSMRASIPTPMGPFPVSPFYDFNKAFEFWMGHTDFPIDDTVAEILDNVPGIEILDIITKYQFRFSVGKMFKGVNVRLNILEVLDAIPPRRGEINPTDMTLPKEVRDKLDILESQAKANFERWVFYILPNGRIDAAFDDNVDESLPLYKKAQELTGGVIITSDSN